MEPYYYNQMDKRKQSAYRAMKTGLTSLAPSFPVPKLTGEELTDIFFRLRLDCPEIFYAVGFHYRYYQDSVNIQMFPEYLFDKAKIQDHQKAMSTRVSKLARPALSMTEWEKERYIHDFVCENIRYDKLKKPYSHEIIGPLGHGVGVCEGIAKTVKILCDELGIWCVIAVSDSNPEKNIKYRHAWNIVRIGGVYYHLDATFDNSLGHNNPGHEGIIRYDYFNLDDRQIFRDHEPVIYPVPSCTDGNHFYYKEKKLSFTRKEDVVNRAGQAVRKNRVLVFHWRGGCLNRNMLLELTEVLEQTAAQKGKHAAVGLNWPQAVLQVSFSEFLPGQELEIEKANEGEEECPEFMPGE